MHLECSDSRCISSQHLITCCHSTGMHLVAQVGQKKSGRTGDQIALHITCDALIMDTLRLHLFLYLKKKSGWTRDQITLPAVDRGCISSPHCQATVASALPSNSSHNNHLNRSGQWWSYFAFGHMNIWFTKKHKKRIARQKWKCLSAHTSPKLLFPPCITQWEGRLKSCFEFTRKLIRKQSAHVAACCKWCRWQSRVQWGPR